MMESNNNQEWKEKQVIKYDKDGRPYLQVSEGINVRMEYDELSEEDKQRALDELRETPENVKAGLEKLRELLKADDRLFVPSEFDDYLMKFLRCTKFYPDSAYKVIRNYYKCKVKYPKYCGSLSIERDRVGFINGINELLPLRSKTNSRLVVLKVGHAWNTSKVSLMEIFRTAQLCLEATVLEPVTQVNGVVVIFDMEGLSFRHIMQFSPNFAMMLLEWIQECVPLRMKAVHIVYNSTIFGILFAMFKPFIAVKLRKRIFFHGTNFENLVESIGADRLRPRYGGTMPCDAVDGPLLAQVFKESFDEFELGNAFGLVENKNVGMPSIVPVTTGKYGPKYALGRVSE